MIIKLNATLYSVLDPFQCANEKLIALRINELTGFQARLPNFFWEISIPLSLKRPLKDLTVVFDIETRWISLLHAENLSKQMKKNLLSSLYAQAGESVRLQKHVTYNNH